MAAMASHIDEVLERLELRPVRTGETIELLYMLRPMGSDSSRADASGSSRPIPRYVDVHSEDPMAIVASAPTPHGVMRTVGVGMIRAVDVDGTVAELQLFVIPTMRRQGVGASMFAALVDLAERRGIRRLRLRLPAGSTGLQRLLSRLSTVSNVREEGEQLVVEFPLAASRGKAGRRRGATREADVLDL